MKAERELIKICVAEIVGNGKYELAEQLQQFYENIIKEMASSQHLDREKVVEMFWNWKDEIDESGSAFWGSINEKYANAICSLTVQPIDEITEKQINNKMKESFEYRLLSYNFTTYCQGTADRGTDYALLYVPEDSSFNNTRSVLLNEKHREGIYEIDIDSVENMTIHW